jgi:hypothetical protein
MQSNAMIEHRRLRAPARDGEALIEPPTSAAEEIVERNAAALRAAEVKVGGRPLAALAAEARQHLLRDARQYTTTYRDAPAPVPRQAPHDRVLLAGHQPQLFHAGVLFKNFALSTFAERLNATAVNLVIDNDAAGAPVLRVPAGSLDNPRLESLPFDDSAPPVPYEERELTSAEVFCSFGRRVQETIQPFVADPIIQDLWPYAIQALGRTRNLGRALAQARHRLEADWRLQTLELPLSEVCRTAPFAWFVASLLAELPRFCEVHNTAVHDYRRRRHLRSRTHPVPALAAEGDWREAPLWVWSNDDPARRRLFARRVSSREVELTDRGVWRRRLPLPETGDAGGAVERLLQLPGEGIKLRTRALTTTLYARLFLTDLFLHGIGGAKYDELTDVLIARFFGMAPPAFYAVTATVLLPVRRPAVSQQDVRQIDRHLRELRFHPEQHLNVPPPDADRHVAAKRRWLAASLPPGAGRERHLGIEEANASLQPFVEHERRRLQAERERLVEELRKERLLGSREFAFCLFPRDELPRRLHGLLEE